MPKPLPPPGRYIDPLVDFAFKKIFGSEPNKDLLIDFLNQVFQGRKTIADLTYGKNDHPGNASIEGIVVFDLKCTGPDGEEFIIEVQRGSQQHFKERALYYTSRLISDSVPRGSRQKWGYRLPEVYLVALLENFALPDMPATTYLHNICLCDRETGSVFSKKLNFTFIELNKFVKEEAALQTDLDKWLYVLKHLSRMDKLPVYLRKPVFEKLFNIAEYSKLTKEDRMNYDSSMKYKWDNENVLEYAIKQAVEKNTLEKDREKEEAIKGNARKMIRKGYPFTEISDITGLTIEEIERL